MSREVWEDSESYDRRISFSKLKLNWIVNSAEAKMGDINQAATVNDDLLLKNFFAEVSEVERDNEVLRYFSSSLSFVRMFRCVIVCFRI